MKLNNSQLINFKERIKFSDEDKKYYQPHSQSILISDTLVDERKFVLSTPYIDYKDQVELFIPFSDERIDFLFKLKLKLCNSNQLKEMLKEYEEMEEYEKCSEIQNRIQEIS